MGKIKCWVLAAILVLGLVLRLWALDKFPSGFSADEASYGYNAYSLLKTGRDEWGEPWYQLIYTNLRSFGDARFPLYSFLAIPSIKLLGLNEFAVRLPNAILGTLAIAAVYLLAKKLINWQTGQLAALLLAISPWHVSLSRGAFETNTLTLLAPLGIYLLLSSRFWLAAVILSLNTYSYIAARALTLPVAIITMWITKASRQNWLKFIVIFLVIAGPGLGFMIKSGNTRVADVGIFNPTDNWHEVATRRFEARNLGLPDIAARIFSNKVLYLASNFTQNYLSYFSPQFLFTSGAGEATYGMIPGRGALYYIEIPFLLLFFISFIKSPSQNKLLLILLLLISPLPAALSKGGGFAANRVASMIPILTIMVSVGIINFLEIFKKYQKSLTIIMVVIYGVSLTFFLEDYFYHGPKVSAQSMSYGWRELMPRLASIAREYDQVFVSRSLSEPHIFVAFYSQMDPKIYQSYSQNWKDFDKNGLKFLDQYDGYYLGKYRFGNLNLDKAKLQKTLLVGRPQDIPHEFGQYFSIYYPNGDPAIQVSKSL